MRLYNRKLMEHYPGDDQSLREGRNLAEWPSTPNAMECEQACTMEIDSPKGKISYQLSVCGKVTLRIHAPDVEAFLLLTDFFSNLEGPLSGKRSSLVNIPSIVEPEDEEEEE